MASILIGLQLPDSGEVLYLDLADPMSQQVLQEAGIHLGEGGVLQTIDGQVLSEEDGNPITTNKAILPPVKQNNLVGDAVATNNKASLPLLVAEMMEEEGIIREMEKKTEELEDILSELIANTEEGVSQVLNKQHDALKQTKMKDPNENETPSSTWDTWETLRKRFSSKRCKYKDKNIVYIITISENQEEIVDQHSYNVSLIIKVISTSYNILCRTLLSMLANVRKELADSRPTYATPRNFTMGAGVAKLELWPKQSA